MFVLFFTPTAIYKFQLLPTSLPIFDISIIFNGDGVWSGWMKGFRIYRKILDIITRISHFLFFNYKMNFGKLIKSIDKSSFFLFSLPHKLYFLTQIHSGLHLVIKFSQTYPIFFHWPPRDLIKNPAVKAAGLCNRNDAHFQKDMVVKAPELPVPWPKIEIDTELIKLINVFVFSWGKHKGPQR